MGKINSFRRFIRKGKYDQNGEYGVLQEAIDRIWGNADMVLYAAEFGAPTKTYCSNIAELPDYVVKHYYDIDPQEPMIKKVEITAKNVNEVIGECNILSVDIDGLDYEVWKAYKNRKSDIAQPPAIVIIEINSSIPPDRMTPCNDPVNGTAYLPMKLLGESKGYFLLCHTGNQIWIRNEYKELFPDADPSFDNSWL